MWGFNVRLKGSGLTLRIATGVRLRRLGNSLCSLGVILRRLGFLRVDFRLRIRVSLGLDLRLSRGPLHRIARFRHVLWLDLRLFDRAAGRFDRSSRTLRGANTLECHSLLEFTREHDFRALREDRDDPRLLQRVEVNDSALDFLELIQAHFGARHGDVGTEAELRQPAIERSLTALESDLVIAALASA